MRLVTIRIMITLLETKRKTTPIILVRERKLSKQPLLRPTNILKAILRIYHVCGPPRKFLAVDYAKAI